MDDLQEKLNEVYTLLSGIPVSGDSVELMAAAKEHLRRIYSLLKKKEEENRDAG